MKYREIFMIALIVSVGLGLVWGEGSIANSYINVTLGDDHHIKLETVGGDPNRTTDDAIQVLNDENTFAVVRVEERLTSDQETSGVSFEVGGDGTAVSVPTVVSGNDIVGEWLIDEEIGEDQNARPINIDIKHKVTVVRDAIRVEYEVTNKDYQAHNIGFLQALNVEVPIGDSNTWVVFLVPNAGILDREKTISSADIPTYIRCANNFQNPIAVLRATIGEWDTSPPHGVMIVNADAFSNADDPWDYQPVGAYVTTSGALVLRWLPRWLQPGQSRKFVFYFGVDWSTNDYTSPAGAAIYAPPNLSPGTTSLTLSCDLYNYSAITFSSAQAAVTLPQGLSLAQGETPVKSFPDIPPRVSPTGPDPQAELTWQINVAQNISGHLPITMEITVPGVARRTLTRYVDIPVNYTRQIYAGTGGICMLSFPFNFADARFDKVLIDLGDITRRVAMWSPKDNKYLFYPTDSQLARAEAGRAYWVKVGAPSATIDVSKGQPSGSPPTPIPTGVDYPVNLDAGWNQIGNPFVYAINWGDVKISYLGQVKGWLDAISAGWLKSFIFYWNPDKNAYEWSFSGSYPLQPWEGYFVKILVPCRFIFSAIPARGIASSKEFLPNRALPAKWLVQLALISGDVKDDANYIGIGEEMAIEKPPSPTGVYLNIIRDGEVLAADVRTLSAQKVWTIEVNAPKGGEIIWKGMENLPKGLRLYIVDENGKRTYMGTTSSYKVEGQRVLRIEALEGRGKAMITGLRVLPQRGGVNIAFSLSAEATVGLKITTPSGANLKVLPQRSLKEGTNSIFWDGKDEKGNPLPAGIYIVEVVARGVEGELSRAIQMFTLR